jgi:hypothetical protein
MKLFRHLFLLWLTAVLPPRPAQCEGRFLRGDVNDNGKLELADPVFSIGFLFLGEPDSLGCLDAADSNDDGKLDVTDPVYALIFLFLGGPAPAAPFPDCGDDPTADSLGCAAHRHCSTDCDAQVQTIARESAIADSCSAIVRLSYTGKEILGWQLICGPYGQEIVPDGCECSECFNYQNPVHPPEPRGVATDFWATGDIGRAGLASARTGLTLFCGVTVFDPDGGGEILYPREWRSAATLEPVCPSPPRTVELDSYNWDGQPLSDPAEAERVLEVLFRTSLPEALSTSGELFDAAILRYSRRVIFADDRGFDPSTGEWIVILNAGRAARP